MKIHEKNNFKVIDEPLDITADIRLQSKQKYADEESLFICNISDIISKHKIWNRSMPRVIPYYAVKCNDDPIVIQTLASLGAGFDCASKGEIIKVMNYGVAAESIIFANPTKQISHLHFANEMNVRAMTVDSNFELYKIHEHYPTAQLVLRIRCDDENAPYPMGEKYGCDPHTDAQELIELAKSLNLEMVGICFHVGTGLKNGLIFEKAIHAARKLFDFAEKVGFKFNLLDIGGGFPGEKNTRIDQIASIVNNSLDLYFPSSNVTIIAEPGRFYVSSAFTLVCQIHSKREIHNNGKIERIMYFINDGIFGSFDFQRYEDRARPIILKPSNDNLFNSTIWGPALAPIDQICKSILLPQLDIGDFILFENMGAYSIPLATSFNGFPLAKIEYVIERKDL